MNFSPQDLKSSTNNLWPCQICGRARACPYQRLLSAELLQYVGCSLCGDVCLDEAYERFSFPDKQPHSKEPESYGEAFSSRAVLAALDRKYGAASEFVFVESVWQLLDDDVAGR